MLIGVGKGKISFPQELFPVENYNSVHDDLFVRVMLFQAATPFAIVCFDLASLQPYAVERFRKQTSEATGIPEAQVWCCVTHTFSAPHTRSEGALARESAEVVRKNTQYLQILSDALAHALQQGILTTEPVKLGYGHTVCSINVNRDIPTGNGWWLGANDLLDSDKSVPFVRIDRMDGTPKAILYGYDVQSSIMDHYKDPEGYGVISGDLAGASCRFIEEQYGEDFVALFLIGAAGDQAPIFKTNYALIGRGGEIIENNCGACGFVFVEALGKKLGSQVIQAAEAVRTDASGADAALFRECEVVCKGQKIATSLADIHPTKTYTYEKDAERAVKLSFFTVGHLALAGLAPELSSVTAMDIRAASPYPVTMVATLVNGGEKYMPERTAYDRITYEAMNSKFAAGSAEAVEEAIIQELKKMKEETGK